MYPVNLRKEHNPQQTSPSENPLSPIRQTPLGFVIPYCMPTASQPPPMTSPTEISTRDADQAGYHLQKLIEIVGNRLTLHGEKYMRSTGPGKEVTKTKGKEPLPLLEPFMDESPSQSIGSSQTKEKQPR
ncbi:hypothetical protein ACOSP7_023202 [Xanthoceras sorbifolium]